MTTINNTNLTILNKEGTACRNAILGNNEAFYNFAKALGAASEIETFLVRLNDQKLNEAYYGKKMNFAKIVGYEHTPIIAKRTGLDGIEREVVVPWNKATVEERENFDMPIKKLFAKVLDIVLRSFIKTSLEVKREHGFAILTTRMSPKEVIFEDILRLAREIEDFRVNNLTF